MFVKETTVRRSGRSYTYLQMVEGYRDERGRVRHRVVANLGRKDALKASGQLEALAGSFARLDPPLVGVRRDVGALLLAAHFINELGLVGTVDGVLPRSARSQLSVGEVAAALVASRLCSSSRSGPTAPSRTATWPSWGHARCGRLPTSPSASGACPRRGARATAARCATGR